MASNIRHLNGFLSLFIFFVYLGCFFLSPNQRPNQHPPPPPPKRRKLVPLSASPPSSSAPSRDAHKLSLPASLRSYLGNLFSSRNKTAAWHQPPPPRPPSYINVESTPGSEVLQGQKPENITRTGAVNRGSFSSRTEIYPCAACGEVLSKPQLLELHQATEHGLSELYEGEAGNNIVQIIFQSGWKSGGPPAVRRVIKIHHAPRALARFEEYRDAVRSRAGGDERCAADGNERLRFYCSTALCAANAPAAGACGSQFCRTCAIVRHGFAGKQGDLDGIATHATGWAAHVSVPDDVEREFAFLHVRRAVLVCRVIAGHVARYGEEKGPFDSVIPASGGGGKGSSWAEGEEELLVFNPRAVLPCFIIIYNA